MPFSDDEQIAVEEKSNLKTVVLVAGIGLFAFSLFTACFCTTNGCRTSLEAFLMGGFAMLTGGAAITWLANPLLFITWILLVRNKKSARFFSLAASVISSSFLLFQTIIENEAGQHNPIIKIGIGYWLWLSSCLTTFLGSLAIRILKHKNS